MRCSERVWPSKGLQGRPTRFIEWPLSRGHRYRRLHRHVVLKESMLVGEDRVLRFLQASHLLHLPFDVLVHSVYFTMHWIISVRDQRQNVRRQLVIPMVAFRNAVQKDMTLGCHRSVRIFSALQPHEKVLRIPFYHAQARFNRVLHGFQWRAGWRRCWYFWRVGERVAMDKRMT